MVIKQLSRYQGNKGSLRPFDIVSCRGKLSDNYYLGNKNQNGWRADHKEAHTNFILEIIK